MFQKDYFLFSYFYCHRRPIVGHFYILNPGFFLPSPQIQLHPFFFKRKFLKILNPACNISAVILVELPSDLFILKLSSYILIPSKENAA